MTILKKVSLVSLLAGLVVVLTGTAAWADVGDPIDIGDTVAPIVGAVMTGIIGAFTELMPIMIPALIALSVIAFAIGLVALVRFRKPKG